jgi:4'-phosphopantetheinyl transferase
VALVADPRGRPRLADPEDSLVFSLSHTGERLLLAVGRERRIGLDVESLGTKRDYLALARHALSGVELASVVRAAGGNAGFAFLELWTAKEALAKALGRGMDAFREIVLARAADESLEPTRLPAEAGDAASWTLMRMEPERGYIAALAVERAT